MRVEVELSANSFLLRGEDLPLSLLIEIVAQSAAYLLSADEAQQEVRLAVVEEASLSGAARPGDRVAVVVEVARRYGRLTKIHGRLEADGAVVGEATMILAAWVPEE